jgi:hypothetical protein
MAAVFLISFIEILLSQARFSPAQRQVHAAAKKQFPINNEARSVKKANSYQ